MANDRLIGEVVVERGGGGGVSLYGFPGLLATLQLYGSLPLCHG